MSKLSDVLRQAGITLQPWQQELILFMLWLREKHPEVELHMVAYPWSPRRNGKATMRRLREEYEAEKADTTTELRI